MQLTLIFTAVNARLHHLNARMRGKTLFISRHSQEQPRQPTSALATVLPTDAIAEIPLKVSPPAAIWGSWNPAHRQQRNGRSSTWKPATLWRPSTRVNIPQWLPTGVRWRPIVVDIRCGQNGHWSLSKPAPTSLWIRYRHFGDIPYHHSTPEWNYELYFIGPGISSTHAYATARRRKRQRP